MKKEIEAATFLSHILMRIEMPDEYTNISILFGFETSFRVE
jgi:hypothetical protein